MKAHFTLCLSVLVLALVAALRISAAAEDSAASQINAEIARLQQSVKDTPITDKSFAEVPAMLSATLKSAADAVKAGNLYLAL